MNFTLRIWRQNGPAASGKFEEYPATNIPEDASFLEMLDIVNEGLNEKGVEPVNFDHDCREGICGTCSLTINGVPHGPERGTTCQLYMRKFQDKDVITIEPFRAAPFPVIRDLSVDRRALASPAAVASLRDSSAVVCTPPRNPSPIQGITSATSAGV